MTGVKIIAARFRFAGSKCLFRLYILLSLKKPSKLNRLETGFVENLALSVLNKNNLSTQVFLIQGNWVGD